jgi:hypothetical protein
MPSVEAEPVPYAAVTLPMVSTPCKPDEVNPVVIFPLVKVVPYGLLLVLAVIVKAAGLTLIVKVVVLVPAELTAFTVIIVDAVTYGVPEIVPSDAVNVSPVGNVPV